MILYALLSCVFLLFIIGYLKIRKCNSYWKMKSVPHEPPQILFGNAKGLGETLHFADLTEKYYKKFKKIAPLHGLFVFLNPVVVVTDLDLIKNVLIKDFNYFADRGMFCNERDEPLLGNLFGLDGPKWRWLRTKLSPTFTSGKMKFMFATMVDVGNQLETALYRITEVNSIVEVKDLLSRFTTDVIGTCAFGIECNSLKDPNAEFRIRGKEIFEKPRRGPLLTGLIMAFPNLAKFLKLKVLLDETSTFFTEVVKKTVNYREQNKVTRNDFMDILIGLQNSENDTQSFSVQQIAAQAFVFFIAGFESSSNTMAFCLHELAQNEDLQEEVRREINNVLAKHNGRLTYESMLEMTLTENVIKETLRKYPPVPVLMRKTVQTYLVPGTSYVIEKNTNVFIPVFSVHNDPDLYPDPQAFKPDRFLDEHSQNRHSCAFLPFGDGPRNCIALRFGMMQMRIGLTVLLQNFRFSVAPTTQIPLKIKKQGLVYAPESGVDLKVTKL